VPVSFVTCGSSDDEAEEEYDVGPGEGSEQKKRRIETNEAEAKVKVSRLEREYPGKTNKKLAKDAAHCQWSVGYENNETWTPVFRCLTCHEIQFTWRDARGNPFENLLRHVKQSGHLSASGNLTAIAAQQHVSVPTIIDQRFANLNDREKRRMGMRSTPTRDTQTDHRMQDSFCFVHSFSLNHSFTYSFVQFTLNYVFMFFYHIHTRSTQGLVSRLRLRLFRQQAQDQLSFHFLGMGFSISQAMRM
jgi:hypothetical protein